MGWGEAHTAKLRAALDVLEPPAEGPWLLVLRSDHSWDESVEVDLGRIAVQELGATGVACLSKGETLEAVDEARMRALGWVRADPTEGGGGDGPDPLPSGRESVALAEPNADAGYLA